MMRANEIFIVNVYKMYVFYVLGMLMSSSFVFCGMPFLFVAIGSVNVEFKRVS